MMNGEFDSRVTFTLLTDPGEDDEGSVDCEDVATAQINLRDCNLSRKDLFSNFIFSQRKSRFARSPPRVRLNFFRSQNSRAAAYRCFCRTSYSRLTLILFFHIFLSKILFHSMPFFIFLLPSWKNNLSFQFYNYFHQNESTWDRNDRVRRRSQASATDAAAHRARDVQSTPWSAPIYDRWANCNIIFIYFLQSNFKILFLRVTLELNLQLFSKRIISLRFSALSTLPAVEGISRI